MSETDKKTESAGRSRAWAFGGVFAALLAALMFFSGTIYQYNLPQVTATSPRNGYLNKRETSSGYADWEAVEKIYAPIAGEVAEVYIKEGDWVNAGQPIVRMTYNRSDSERKLQDIENSRNKLAIDIEGINLRIERTKRAISDHTANQAEAKRQYDKAATKSTTSNDLELQDIDIRKANQTLEDTQLLYDLGAATQREVTAAQDNLATLKLKRESTVKSIEEQKEKDADSLDSLWRAYTSYQKTIADSKADLTQLEFDLESRSFDLTSYDLQSAPYNETLAEFDANGVITAKSDGVVLSVNAEAELNIGEKALVATVGVGNTYVIECQISLDNNFVFPGDSCELSNTAHVLYGLITSITPGDRGKALKIEISSDEVTAGETFNLTFERRSDVRYTLVPNGALNQDSDGYYVNQVKKRNGLLGDEYYLSRLDVYIGDSDSQNTVLTGGMRFFEPIVLTSDKTVQPGDTITLINEADFFAN